MECVGRFSVQDIFNFSCCFVFFFFKLECFRVKAHFSALIESSRPNPERISDVRTDVMSFDREKDVVELGDTAMLYLGFDNIHALTVDLKKKNRRGEEEDHVVQTNYGALRVGDLVGKQFGSRVQLTRGYGFILHPTPELWTRTLRHRTQILYAADISLIVAQLELRPGSIGTTT